MSQKLNRTQLVSIHGRRFGFNKGGHLLFDGALAAAHYTDRGIVARQVDHFLGNTMQADQWTTVKGSDAGCALFAKTAKAGGYVKGITGADAGNTMVLNGCQITSSKDFQPDFDQLIGGSAVQLSAITNVCLFVGFLDAITLNMPFTIAGGALTANATDGAGFLFDTGATAATWKCVSVNNGGTPQLFDTGLVPVVNTDDLLNVSFDLAGNASFWMNGNAVNNQALAVLPSHGLAFGICAFSRTAVDINVLADFIAVEQSR